MVDSCHWRENASLTRPASVLQPSCSQGEDFNGLYADAILQGTSAIQRFLQGLAGQGYAWKLLTALQVRCDCKKVLAVLPNVCKSLSWCCGAQSKWL